MRALRPALLLLLLAGCTAEKANGRPWIHDIRFEGLHKVSKRDLKGKLGIEEKSWVPLSPKHYLDPYAMPMERERVLSYYHSHGYFDTRVTAADAVPRKDKDSVDVVFKLIEGEATKIRRVEVTGTDRDPALEKLIQKRLKVELGEIFDHDTYIAKKAQLERIAQEQGYAWAEITGRVEVNRPAHTADVYFALALGQKAKFGKVTITGTQRIRPIDAERTADMVAGEPFRPTRLEEARARLYNSGVFASVKVTFDHDPNDASIADVRFDVKEGPFNELRLGGGFGIESQRNDVHLSATYTRRNFLGDMRLLRLRLEPGFVVIPAIWNLEKAGPALLAEAELTQPLLFGVRHLTVKFVVGYDIGIDYAYQYEGPRTTVGFTQTFFRSRLSLGFSFNFQFLDFFKTQAAILDDPAASGRVYGYRDPYRLGWWQQDVALDLRDRPLEPHKGAYFAITAEEGGAYAGGAFQYEKIVPDARLYAPLGSRVTLAGRFEFGQIFTQGSLGSPITRRLYLGGPSSHRGFNYNRLAYQIQALDKNKMPLKNVLALPIGGDQMVLVQGEVRVRIVKLFGNWFGAVAFADGGDVTTPSCGGPCKGLPATALQHIDFTKLHWAVGGGLRYQTVIGTIRADVGVRITRFGKVADGSPEPPNPDSSSRLAFHLSVGEAF